MKTIAEEQFRRFTLQFRRVVSNTVCLTRKFHPSLLFTLNILNEILVEYSLKHHLTKISMISAVIASADCSIYEMTQTSQTTKNESKIVKAIHSSMIFFLVFHMLFH